MAKRRGSQQTIDDLLQEQNANNLPPVLRVSVSKILDALFPAKKQYISFGYLSGKVLHYRLGFTNDKLYCRFYDLSQLGFADRYLEICGAPDRISYDNGILYVDELKTTKTGKEKLVIKIAEAQLQLYMFITGIKYGRIYVYYKDTGELKLVKIVEYDESKIKEILKRYLLIRQMQVSQSF